MLGKRTLSLLIPLALAVGFGLLNAPKTVGQGNPTCPTRPSGDSSNACASTAFVQGAVVGAVSPGTAGQVAYYPSNGSSVSGFVSGNLTGTPVWTGTHTFDNATTFLQLSPMGASYSFNGSPIFLFQPKVQTLYVSNLSGSGSASINGTVMTVTGMSSGSFVPGQTVTGGTVSGGTVITSYGSGQGGNGTYNVNNSQVVAAATLTGTGAATPYTIASFSMDTGAGSSVPVRVDARGHFHSGDVTTSYPWLSCNEGVSSSLCADIGPGIRCVCDILIAGDLEHMGATSIAGTEVTQIGVRAWGAFGSQTVIGAGWQGFANRDSSSTNCTSLSTFCGSGDVIIQPDDANQNGVLLGAGSVNIRAHGTVGTGTQNAVGVYTRNGVNTNALRTVWLSDKIGFVNETNPAQSQIVFGFNATPGITLPGVTTNGTMLIGPDNFGQGYGHAVTVFGGNAINQFMRANNTNLSPMSLNSGEVIGGIVAGGYTGSGWTAATRARILATASEAWSPTTKQGAGWGFDTVKANTTTRSPAMAVQAGLYIGPLAIGASPGAPDPGFGVVNLSPQTFATLTACSVSLRGSIAAVSDSNTITWGAVVAGLSSSAIIAHCNGSNWTVMGK